jgi:hypothetical protein
MATAKLMNTRLMTKTANTKILPMTFMRFSSPASAAAPRRDFRHHHCFSTATDRASRGLRLPNRWIPAFPSGQ